MKNHDCIILMRKKTNKLYKKSLQSYHFGCKNNERKEFNSNFK